MSSMTLEQAADVLGIPVSASKAEIAAAYRKKVAKYHPDAHINASDEERAYAEMMFKKVSMARKVMSNPASAAQPQMPQYRPPQPQTRTYTQQPRPQQSAPTSRPQSYSAQQSPSSGTTRTPYNQSRRFNGTHIDRVVSDAEKQVHGFHEDEAREMYKKKSDVFRITPTIMTTLAFLAWAVASVVTDPAGFEAVTLQNPFIWLGLVCLIKLVFYDVLLSYPVFKLCDKAHLGWTFVLGLDTIVLGIITFILLTMFGGFAQQAFLAIGLGVVFVLIGLTVTRSKQKIKAK